MKTYFAAVLCAALAPLAAFALSDYIDEYVDEVADELGEWGVPVGDGAENPAAPAPGDPASPSTPDTPAGPATKVKTDYAPLGDEGTIFFVTSSPAAAPVKVDGRDAGTTPVYFTDLTPGRHAVSVGSVADEVELRPGGVTHLDVSYAASLPDKEPTPVAGKYVDNRDNYFELHIGDR
jgi:hypothetical protein